MNSEKHNCLRCRMIFRVGLPRRNTSANREASWTRCSVPGCGQRFWHGFQSSGKVLCGIAPQDLPDRAA